MNRIDFSGDFDEDLPQMEPMENPPHESDHGVQKERPGPAVFREDLDGEIPPTPRPRNLVFREESDEKLDKLIGNLGPLIDSIMRGIGPNEREQAPSSPPRVFGETGRLCRRLVVQLVALLLWIIPHISAEASIITLLKKNVGMFHSELASGGWDEEFAEIDRWVDKSLLRRLFITVCWVANLSIDYNRVLIPLLAFMGGLMI
jgi:hypothetical protein